MDQPHDTLFHFFLHHRDHAAPWLRALLAPALAAAIDWSTFAPCQTRIPGIRLRAHHADLVFTADVPQHDEVLVFVLEHAIAIAAAAARAGVCPWAAPRATAG